MGIVVLGMWAAHLVVIQLPVVCGAIATIACSQRRRVFWFLASASAIALVVLRTYWILNPSIDRGTVSVWEVYFAFLFSKKLFFTFLPVPLLLVWLYFKRSEVIKGLLAGVLLSFPAQFVVTVFFLDYVFELLGLKKGY
jgi:hypothetical protein